MKKERGGNEVDPRGTEATIYEPASQDWLVGVGGTCQLTLHPDKDDKLAALLAHSLMEKTKNKS